MKVTVAATQFACTENREENLAHAESIIRAAAAQGANIILIQELFETPYFCKEHDPRYFSLARTIDENPAVARFRALARELNVVLPASVFEREGNAFYNSIAIIDVDGGVLGTYRKAHIPESPGYHEKFYFSPGDTGFKVWKTRFGTIGVAICWDQWFPESARAMAVMGAEMLFYPTAIGAEPQDLSIDSRDHWQRAMQGHAASNIMPLVASNRIGTEQGERWKVSYYGSSFIADHTGALVKEADRTNEAILTATFDLEAIRNYRNAWGVFRDRRPELYGPIMTLDGHTKRQGMQFFASCPPGVADLTAAELRDCGATQCREFKLGVQFEGELESAYRACLWSRTASRILMPLGSFPAATPDALYEGVKSIAWTDHVKPTGTLAVDLAGATSGITHTHFGALKTKDAIVDFMRERTGERPSVELEQPDVRIDVRLDRDRATVSLDLSGDSLHRRAYRARGVAAPLKENLAAAILLRSGWPAIAEAGGELVDPMCGSGTLPIEAALIALDIAPGSMRSYFGFIGWVGHDRELWRRLVEEARERRNATLDKRLTLRGFDQDPGAVRAAIENVERARLRKFIHIERRDLAQLTRDSGQTGLVVTNPPYGERIGDQERLQSVYELLGAKLREQFEGWRGAVFTGNPPLAKAIGINAKRSHTLFNGRIECRLLRFDIEPSEYRGAARPPRTEEDQQQIRNQPGAQMFANRLRKNLKAAQDWAQREGVYCYRVYDADMPEYAFAIDLYGNGADAPWAYVQEYEAPRTIDPESVRARRREVLAVIPDVLQLPQERIHLRRRRQQKGVAQYEKVSNEREFEEVSEGPYRFLVNFHDYLDTGLFLDHRITRRRVGELARGKRFLNLFAYTGTATVYAAGGGAASSTTVDMSRTYLDWAKRNLALNDMALPQHGFVQADCMAWLREQQGKSRTWDLMFIDPPTHSRSKRMEDDFDVQRDHVSLLMLAARLLAPQGVIVFSNNYTRFRLDRNALAAFAVEDLTTATLPWDFRRSPKIHQCYVLTLVDPAKIASPEAITHGLA